MLPKGGIDSRTVLGWNDVRGANFLRLGIFGGMDICMKTIRAMIAMLCVISPLLHADDTKATKVAVSDAKNHIGETAMVCGKVVASNIPKYGIGGRGKPVSLFLDQPEANPVFYFVVFGQPPDGPQEVVNAYQGKQVCVTGKIDALPSSGLPFIMAADRAQVKVDAPSH